jgi:UPF0271 protein
MTTIDLNSDMGEYATPEWLAREAELIPLITSANIACGVHAGNPHLIRRTARLASQHNVAIGAHPGLPDTEHFGRRDRQISPEEVVSLLSSQLETLTDVLSSEQLTLAHVKLHGALYNLAARDHRVAEAVARTIISFDPHLLLFALAGSELAKTGRTTGLTVIEEAFADRAYRSDGTLVPRTQPGALLETPQQVWQQLRAILKGSITSVDGQSVPIRAGTLCVHLDSPHALAFLRLIRQEIESAGIRIAKPLSS